MPTTAFVKKSELDRAFAAVEAAAVAGERCPQNRRRPHNPNSPIASNTMPRLAMQGKILIEISGHNFRRVTILVGPHAGKSTAPDPNGGQVWQIIDKNGTHLHGVARERAYIRGAA